MLPKTVKGVAGGAGKGRQSDGRGGAPCGEERRQRPGVQEWPDGSRYEGDFVNGLKHGKGKFTCSDGEYYKGSFYKDYQHGDGLCCWPSGHKFTGKFYLNRKEGYGQLVFPDGGTFKGLYHKGQKLGPGVFRASNGRQDVGMWRGQHLLGLCTSVGEGFSLKSLPEYAAFMDSSFTTDSLTPSLFLSSDPQMKSKLFIDRDLPSDETFIYPPGIEKYSTDGDHLPLPTGRRRELDQQFYGKLWEPDPYQGCIRDPLSTLPLQARIQANIHKHRLQAKNVGWNVAGVVSLNRDSFGPKGPVEVYSEQLFQHSAQGELQAVLKVLQTGLVHPDVADSQGHTALIAATVNCHNNVIHLLLDMGVDIDKLNCEGMSALAVCYVLYYPFQCLDTTLAEPPAKTPVDSFPSSYGTDSQIDQEAFTTDTPLPNNRPHTSDTSLGNQDNRCPLSDQTSENLPGEKEEHVKLVESRDTKSNRENMEGKEEVEEEREGRGSEDVPGVERYIQVLDGHIRLGSGQWRNAPAKQGNDNELTPKQNFDSACSVSSYNNWVTEEVMQHSEEALSLTGFPEHDDTQGAVRKMAAMEIEHRTRLSTLKLLLDRGADPNRARVPMHVLFIAIMAADIEAVRRLLLCGARADVCLSPEKKCLYPLHVAAALPGTAGPRITELLLHTALDPDVRACDQDDVYEPDGIKEPLSMCEEPCPEEGGRTALHVACQRNTDYQHASEVVDLLLSHNARTDLLWSRHSPLSLAIASGNDLAVEALLNRGADPNTPLGPGVRSALCALSNINYNLCGNKIKLLEMLAKAGADILMPVILCDAVGTAVDYAHYYFNQDVRIATTPFAVLNRRERETLKARRLLLKMMADLLRQTFAQRERENLKRERLAASNYERVPGKAENQRKPVFKFCYHCGRSVFVQLTPCSRCKKVFHCSRSCKLQAWTERHKLECNRMSADGVHKNVMFNPDITSGLSQNSEEKDTPFDDNLNENYSFN
ncbi:ankyrin repeat and MYND domain-containing protein 1 [Brachyistius frenatus]|uniref:ankyrin repeat and MYND domain-containing protein 1 n=1 Tax=Brachyistius frenatus TaxID=100188 RepID=UPI0037E96BB0